MALKLMARRQHHSEWDQQDNGYGWEFDGFVGPHMEGIQIRVRIG